MELSERITTLSSHRAELRRCCQRHLVTRSFTTPLVGEHGSGL